MQATTTQQDNARQAYLEALYRLDGRDNPDHPQHGTYTGLYAARIAALLQDDREILTGLASTQDDDDTPLYTMLSGYIGPGLIADNHAAAAVSAAWCRVVAARLSFALYRLDPPGSKPQTFAMRTVRAIVDWLHHEAVRAELFEVDVEPLDCAPSSREVASV